MGLHEIDDFLKIISIYLTMKIINNTRGMDTLSHSVTHLQTHIKLRFRDELSLVARTDQPTRKSTAASISTRRRLPHSEPEHSFMMNQHHIEKIWPNGGSIRATRSTLGVEIWILLVWERCQQWRNVARKFGVTSAGRHIGLVLRGCVLTACLARSMRTCTEARVCAWTPALISPQLLDLLRLTLVTDHE